MFIPEPRSAGRQRFCIRIECRRASRRESQQRWQAKIGNQTYHTGAEQIARVQAWRLANPGYWRKKSKHKDDSRSNKVLSSVLLACALQEPCATLQDSWDPYLIALIGLIARIRGTALQDIIAEELSSVMLTGRDILQAQERPPQ